MALMLCGGLLAACGQAASPGGRQPGAAQEGSFHTETALGAVRLSVGVTPGPRRASLAASAGEQGLVVDYELVNTGTEPVLVEDRVPDSLGSGVLPRTLDPERAWVYLADGHLRVSKQGFSPAPGVRFIAAPVTGARLLGAHGHLAGRAWVPLPPRLDVPGPQFQAPRTPIDPRTTEVQLCLQLGSPANARPSTSGPSVLEVPVAAPGPKDLLCSPIVGLPGV